MVIERTSVDGLDRALAVPRDATHYLRILAAMVVGAISALVLGWFMQYLIRTSDLSLEDSSQIHMLEFVRVKREETLERKDRKPPKPQLEQTPEVPPMPQDQVDAGGQQLTVSAMPADVGLDISRGGIGFGAGEGDYLPIVKVAPIFPQRAAALGIFGECLVEYTVTAAGTTKDVRVRKERCTNAVFYRPSVEAAGRFKYKPRIIDGEAVEVEGVLNMFYYTEVQPE